MPPAMALGFRGMQRFLQGPPLEMLATELLYFLVVVGICLIIYLKTRGLYKLSQHKGLFHFRNIFLYFAIAYSFRLILLLSQLSFEVLELGRPWGFFLVLPLVSYFSTLAILSLAMALVSSRLKYSVQRETIALNLIAFASLILVFATNSEMLLVTIQAIVLLASVLAIFMASKKGKRKLVSPNRVTYLLLAGFWVVNLLAFSKRLLPRELKLVFYILSAAVFISICLRVRTRLLSNAKKKQT